MDGLFKENKKFLIITFIFTLITALLTVSVPLLLTTVFGENYNINKSTLLLVIIFMFITYIIQIVMVYIREHFAYAFNVSHTHKMYRLMHKMNYDDLLQKEPTYLIDRFAMIVNSFYMFIANTVTSLMSNIIILFVCLAIILKINIWLAVILFLLIPVNYFGYKLINKKLMEKSKVMQQQTSTGYKEIIGIFNNVDMVKQTSYDRIENLIRPSVHRIFHSMKEVNKFAQSTSLMIKLLNSFIQNMMYFVLAYFIYTGQTEVSALVIVSIVLPIYFVSLQAFTSINLEYRDMQVSNEFITDEILPVVEKEGHKSIDGIDKITIKDATVKIGDRIFQYDVDETFIKGDIVFVTGTSGSGKSTLMKSLLKYRTSSGVMINEQSVNELNNQNLREQIYYLSQDSSILPMSIKDNIVFGKDASAIDWDMMSGLDVLQSVLTHHNLDEVIYEKGTNFSGGEKQRIMISRLFHEQVDCVILDEVTSNIDIASQQMILESVLKYCNDKIVFIISHDPEVERFTNRTLKVG
ncbi:ABC transporter ATP-binding protein [Macrococcoides canis]|uniref:ATP-binding cassette domain-containing protein n=1 Tax=Macrococcoides canis TaxID=1855823 RepID=UPI00105F1FA2|nr:ABC transporter ATP-binding protein [Macrococcus canis]TDM32391.1 ABC transporter ATP-binding protein [Macrococcus canis]